MHKIGSKNAGPKIAGSETADRVCTGAVVTRSGTGIACDRSPLRMVEHVEGLCTELNGGALFYRKVLEQRHVEVNPIGIAQTVPSRISEG